MNKSTGSTAGWSESELVFYVRGWYSRKTVMLNEKSLETA